MKKFIASAGLVTVGAVGLQAAYAPGLSTMETSKPWSVAATLRGFYDDNYNNAPAHPSDPAIPKAKGSGGFEISPSVRLNFPMEQTYVGVSYLYSLKYYFDRKNNNTDQLHELTLKVDHRFSPRYKASFDDSFVYSVEPTIIDSSGAVTAPTLRDNADAIRNRATVGFAAQITEILGVEASYQNTYYDYLKSAVFKAALNRDEHVFDVHGTWLVQEHLVGLLGYEYEINDYLSNDFLDPANPGLRGNDRDDRSHYFYVGAEHAFSSQFNGSIRVGAQYTTYDHIPNSSSWNPYVDLRGTYTYLPGSSVQFGFTQTRNATDVTGSATTSDNLVLDQESSTVFASVHHRITPLLTGSLLGQYQRSSYNGGGSGFDGKVDNFFLVGVSLEYRINEHWQAELGYNFDRLDSDLTDRNFSRNRVYAGVRANF